MPRRSDSRTAPLPKGRGARREKPPSSSVPSKGGNSLEAQVIRRTMVLEQVSTGILLLDTQGVVTFMNSAFERACGGPPKDIIGQSVGELSHRRWNSDITGPLLRTLASGQPWQSYLMRRSGTDEREWMVRASALNEPGGRLSGFIVTMRDVTAERKVENRLRQVQKMEALGNLARGIAHDLRNIFSPIIVNMELLLMEPDKEPRERAYLEQVHRAARRGRELVDQITMFGRGGAGERRIVSVRGMIEDSLKILGPTLPANIEVLTRLSAADDRVSSDPAHIHQILMNLFSNAVQAMTPAGGSLQISLGDASKRRDSAAPAAAFLDLRVRDTGCGMSAETADRIFEPFFTTKDGGSGMGLAVVHGIVTGLGGTITVESKPGRGSEFRVLLPRPASAAIRPSRPARRTAREEGP